MSTEQMSNLGGNNGAFSPETVDLRRLYGRFNRETIEKMKTREMEIIDEPYDLTEVLRYVQDEAARKESMLTDRNAMKAELFVEWLQAQE